MARKGQKPPKRGLDRQKGLFWPFWPKIANFSDFPEKYPGSYRGKSAQNAQNRAFSLKGVQNSGPGQGFYINPSRRGPAVPGRGKKAGFGPLPGQGDFPVSREDPGEASRDPGPRDPGPPVPRGPGARG